MSVAKIGQSVLFLALAGIGVYFAHRIWSSQRASAEVAAWDRVECSIVSSEVEENPGAAVAWEAYRFRVAYRYVSAGEEYGGSVYRQGYTGSERISDAFRLRETFPAGSAQLCYVDPQQPAASALAPPGKWGGSAWLVPTGFLCVGLGLLYLLWRPERDREAVAPGLRSEVPEPAAESFLNTGTWICGGLALFGIGLAAAMFLPPAAQVWAARSWAEVPCEILHAAVRSHPGDDQATFSVEVLFLYSWEGRELKSSRYGFTGGSTSDEKKKSAIVDRLSSGTQTVCYVDPNDPFEAVLDRGLSAAAYWFLDGGALP